MTIKDMFSREITVTPWDGKTSNGLHYNGAVESRLVIDGDGNVWYEVKDGKHTWSIWCAAGHLNAHVHYLAQIAAR